MLSLFSGVHSRRATNSLDSLNGSLNGNRPENNYQPATSVNVSHDSGLSDLHASVEDFDDDLSDRPVGTTYRSLSQCDDSSIQIHPPTFSNEMMTKSVDNLSLNTRKVSSTTASLIKSATLDNRSQKRLNDFIMSRSLHYTTKNGNTSESSDSLYESLESTCSFEPIPVPPTRKSKRTSSVDAELVRSPSGEHLISTILVNSNPNGEIETENNNKKQSFSSSSVVVQPSSSPRDKNIIISNNKRPSLRNSSPSTVSFMDRYSFVRKPARHRKGQAPSPPQPKKQSSLSGTDDTDEKSSRSSTPPLIIRCQSSSGASLVDEECDDSQQQNFSRPPSSTPISSQYPFLVINSSVINDDEDKQQRDDELRLTQLSDKVLNGLHEISDQVNNVQQKNTFLTGRFNEIINDSSTLTDTSSEERTPHVSREGSRARDCKQVANTLFSKPIERTEVCANLRSFSVNVDYSAKNSLSKRMSHSVVDDELSCLRKKLDLQQQQRRPPSYHEAVQQKTTQTSNDNKLKLLDALRSLPSSSINRMSASMIVSSKSSDVLQSSANLDKSPNYCRTTSSNRYSVPSSIIEPVAEKSRIREISWSVKEKVNLFDKSKDASSSSSTTTTTHGRLSRNRTNVYERLNLEINNNRPLSFCDASTLSTKKESNLMTASSCAALPPSRLSSLVRLSDSHANYPVVRPPPLTTRLSNFSTPLTLRSPKLANHQMSTGTYRSTSSGALYRPNRSQSVHHPLTERRPFRSDNESYV